MPRKLEKPEHLEIRRNADGSERHYWVVRGRKPVRLSDAWDEACREARERNAELEAERCGLDRRPAESRRGTVAWLAAEYKRDPEYLEKAGRTRRHYDDAAAWFLDLYRDLPATAVTPAVIQVLKRDGARTPAQTNARLRFVRLLYNWGRRHGFVRENPAERMRQLTVRPREVVWTDAEIAAFMRDACGSMRLAVTLALYTLQREGDLLAATWKAFDGPRWELRQSKTGKLVAAETHRVLRAALATARPRATSVQILVSEVTGRPYSEDLFRHVFALERGRLGLRRELQFRDLRRTGAVTLGRAGVPHNQIAALGGWSISRTSKILETYMPLDEAMATAAVRAWPATVGSDDGAGHGSRS